MQPEVTATAPVPVKKKFNLFAGLTAGNIFKWLGITLGVFAVLLVTYLYAVDPFAAPSDVRVTNLSDRSASISWVTDKPSRGVVLYGKENSFKPGILASLGASVAHDDRDVAQAVLDGAAELEEDLSARDAAISSFELETDISVTSLGRYYVHHVTVKDLDPSTQYFFMVGDGIRFVDAAGSFADDEFTAVEQNDFTTFPDLEELQQPNPTYGKVVSDDESVSAVNDAIVFLKPGLGSSSVPQSTVMNEDGNWYVDISNIRDLEVPVNILTFNEDVDSHEVFVEAGEFGESLYLVEPMYADAPMVDITVSNDWEEEEGAGQNSFIFNVFAQKKEEKSDKDPNKYNENGKIKKTYAEQIKRRLARGDAVNLKQEEKDALKNDRGVDVDALKPKKQETATVASGGGCYANSDGTPSEINMGGGVIYKAYCCQNGAWGDAKLGSAENACTGNKGGASTAYGGSSTPSAGSGKVQCKLADGTTISVNSNWECHDYIGSTVVSTPSQTGSSNGLIACKRGDGKVVYVANAFECSDKLSGTTMTSSQDEAYQKELVWCETKTGRVPVQISRKACNNISGATATGTSTVSTGTTPIVVDNSSVLCKIRVSPTRTETRRMSRTECANQSGTPTAAPENPPVLVGFESVVRYCRHTQSFTVLTVENKPCPSGYTETAKTTVVNSSSEDNVKPGVSCVGIPLDTVVTANGVTYSCTALGLTRTVLNPNYVRVLDEKSGNHVVRYCHQEGTLSVRTVVDRYCPSGFTETGIKEDVKVCNDTGGCICDGKLVSQGAYCTKEQVAASIPINVGDPCDGVSCWCQGGAKTRLTSGEKCEAKPKQIQTIPSGTTCKDTTCACSVLINFQTVKVNIGNGERCSTELIEERLNGQSSSNLVYAQTGITVSPSEGVFAIEDSGVYCATYNGEQYCFDVSEKGSKTLYIDANSNGIFDGTDVNLGDDAVNISVALEEKTTKYSIKQGFNLVSFNFVNNEIGTTAKEWLEYLNTRHSDAFYSIAKFESGKWVVIENRDNETYGTDNFQIMPGVGYLLKSKYDMNLSLGGKAVVDAVPVKLQPGWNLIAINGNSTAYTAESLIDDVNTLEGVVSDNVTKWDTSLSRYVGLEKEATVVYGLDYPLTSIDSYFLRVKEGSGVWTPQ